MEEDDEMEEGVRKDSTKVYDDDAHTLGVESEGDMDECIRTITCEGNCSSNLEMSCQVPVLEVGRGKSKKNMQNMSVSTGPTVHLDSAGYVNECIQTVQCAGDCACMTHISTPESVGGRGGGGVATQINTNTCSKGEHQTGEKQKISSKNNICSAGRYKTHNS